MQKRDDYAPYLTINFTPLSKQLLYFVEKQQQQINLLTTYFIPINSFYFMSNGPTRAGLL